MKHFMSALFFIFSTNAYAIFCPTNFNNINYGDTLDQVLQQCGKPNTQNTYVKNPAVPQEWNYYLKIHPFDPVTTKMTLVFKDDKVIYINIAGSNTANSVLCRTTRHTDNNSQQMQLACGNPYQSQYNVASTTICGPSIKIGDTPQAVEFACGKPIFVTQSQTQDTTSEITELSYQGMPTITLIFENGRLKQRK